MDPQDIRDILAFNGWTHADMARYMLVAEATISRWANGKRRPLSYGHVNQLKVLLRRVRALAKEGKP